jgi:hypothetical protein
MYLVKIHRIQIGEIKIINYSLSDLRKRGFDIPYLRSNL